MGWNPTAGWRPTLVAFGALATADLVFERLLNMGGAWLAVGTGYVIGSVVEQWIQRRCRESKCPDEVPAAWFEADERP